MGGGYDAGDGVVPVFSLGHLRDDPSRALAYAAADVSLSCSSEDNLPSTVVESLACGTPVVAYRVGGMADMLDDGVNGFLAAPRDVAGLVRGMVAVLADRHALAVAARDKAEQCFDINDVATIHSRLYESLLAP
jgi:glycosyltransferase involved in cell wall biosynthesis